jgi:hypothetical protein
MSKTYGYIQFYQMLRNIQKDIHNTVYQDYDTVYNNPVHNPHSLYSYLWLEHNT